MIPHLIDLICRGLSLAALVWGVFSMGFSSAERKSAAARIESQPENSEVRSVRFHARNDHHHG